MQLSFCFKSIYINKLSYEIINQKHLASLISSHLVRINPVMYAENTKMPKLESNHKHLVIEKPRKAHL